MTLVKASSQGPQGVSVKNCVHHFPSDLTCPNKNIQLSRNHLPGSLTKLVLRQSSTDSSESELWEQCLEGTSEDVIYYSCKSFAGSQLRSGGMPELSDQKLVQAFKEGDETAFEELVLRYRNQVYNTILNVIRDRELAWDGSQEVFIKVYQKLDTFKSQCPVGAWIYRIALNHGINMLRKRKKIREELPLVESYVPADPSNGPAQAMMSEEFENEELSSAIEDLPKVQKSVIILRHFSQLSFREIAEVMGKSEDSVKSNHYYAITKLRRKMKREDKT